MARRSTRLWLPPVAALAPALAAYSFLAHGLRFIQDDAYISYRYVANYLNGDGLVFNIGERVEGFTNFGWVVWMILWGSFGEVFIDVSRLTGLVCGAGVIVVTYLIARELLDDQHWWLAVLPTWLVGANSSLAYWAPAGLETAAFALFAMLAVYLYLRRSWLLIWALVMAVWLRPEGALVTAMLMFLEAIERRSWPGFTFRCAAAAFVLSLPMVGFKIAYYGGILPNPFYAKTGLSLDQLFSGFEYVGRFARHYGFLGVPALVGLIAWRKWTWARRSVWLFLLTYVVYIALVGGDVLKVHRFFLPLLGLSAIVATLGVSALVRYVPSKARVVAWFLVSVGLPVLTVWAPWGYVNHYNAYEKSFIARMRWLAQQLEGSDSANFSVALPTIGVFGYELVGHRVIDMVGLTDSTIARHPEEPMDGIETTWKERQFNTRYLLQEAPDYIVFSTGIKPSAPAERVLCLYRQFQHCYRTRGWPYRPDPTRRGTLQMVFKRERPVVGPFRPTYPVAFVQHYKAGLDAYVSGDHQRALAEYDRALAASPQPYYVNLLYQKALSHQMLKQFEPALQLLHQVLAQDSLVFEAHKDLYRYSVFLDDAKTAALHERWIKQLVPWFWTQLEQDVATGKRELMRLQRERAGS